MDFDDSDLTNLMNSFSLGDDVKDSEIEDILPYMTNMMQKLLSKELLFPVLSDIVDRVCFSKYVKQFQTIIIIFILYWFSMRVNFFCSILNGLPIIDPRFPMMTLKNSIVNLITCG